MAMRGQREAIDRLGEIAMGFSKEHRQGIKVGDDGESIPLVTTDSTPQIG